MPTPCYISITGQTQGNITAGAFTADSVGNIYVQGHEDEMLVQEFLHNVTVPTDPQSGQPAGQRAHKPFIFTVALNKAVPLMYNALASGEMLPTTELHWWRTSVEGKQEHYFTNRIAEDAHYVYHYDEYGRLTEKTDRIPTGVIRTDDERTHYYHYDSQHRLVFHTRIQHGEPLVESRYLYDPLGRRMAKRVWRRERDLTGWMSLSRKPEETWYGWDGDRLTTVQTDTTRIQTVYQPGSFAPLIRIETDNGEREKAQCRSLAEKI
ncbi:type VI secretion system tube protein Hcp, partial [Escherichia coli]|nr:type VI secretion system tube protein Hcp [Escherichia coli]